MKSIKRHADIYSGSVFALIGVYFYWKAGKLPNEASVYPKMVLIIWILLSVLLVLRGLRISRHVAKSGDQVLSIHLKEIFAPMVMFLCTIVYVVLMNVFGFFVTTAIFMPAAMYALGQRSWIGVLVTTLGLEVFVYFLFVMQLRLRMP